MNPSFSPIPPDQQKRGAILILGMLVFFVGFLIFCILTQGYGPP